MSIHKLAGEMWKTMGVVIWSKWLQLEFLHSEYTSLYLPCEPKFIKKTLYLNLMDIYWEYFGKIDMSIMSYNDWTGLYKKLTHWGLNKFHDAVQGT